MVGLGNNGVFSVKSFYEKLLVREEHVFPCNAIWIPKLPRRVRFFTWLATRGVIFTAEFLRKQKVACVSLCYMCKEMGKDVDSLLLNCGLTMWLCWGLSFV